MIHNPNREGKHPQHGQQREIFAFKTWICIRRQHIQDTYFKSETVYFDKLIARNATMCSPMPPSMEFVLWLNTQHPSLERDPAKPISKPWTEKEVTTPAGGSRKFLGTRGRIQFIPFSLFSLFFFFFFLSLFSCSFSVKSENFSAKKSITYETCIEKGWCLLLKSKQEARLPGNKKR